MVTIPTEIVKATRLTDQEVLLEIAVMLFQKEKLSLGQAASLANMPKHKFQFLLASRDIALHYDVEDYQEDLNTIQKMKFEAVL